MADKNREILKQKLKQRVVDPRDLEEEPAGSYQGDATSGSGNPRGRKRFLIILFAALVLAILITGGILLTRRQFGGYDVSWTTDFAAANGTVESDYESYEPFGKGMIKVTRDGASYIDASGKTIWNQSYEMNTPYVSVNGDYCAIADQTRTTIYILSTSGLTGQAETSLPITKVSVSSEGVVYALLEDSNASYITVFTREGAALDITIKSVLSGDGYPVDISVSPDGTEVIASFAYLTNGTLNNKIIFYNLGEVGQNASTNRVVGGFTDDFAGHLTGRVHFSDNSSAQAFYDGGIAFFSTKVLTSPELIKNEAISQTIRAIAYDHDYVGLVTDNVGTDSQEPYRLMLYKTNGTKLFDKPVSFNFERFDISNGHILLYNDTSLEVYDNNGNLKYQGNLDTTITRARVMSGGVLGLHLLVGSEGKMESVRLK
ncbi:DUF5711 family protein [Oribacterium sp. HCP28S3_H8]|uniref:DUF5711 family protein n=1 Tax=Oribacterium sp. HCP28S3_H8 TaxID=3438945 RepID=UPI00303231C9|nr:DUF5711 family protein [Oribacterium sp.]